MKSIRFYLSVIATLCFAATASAQTVGIATTGSGTLFNRIAIVFGKMMNEKMGVEARVQPFSGTSTFVPIINSNEIQFGILNIIDGEHAYHGTANFAGRPNRNLKFVTAIYQAALGFMVPADSRIKSLKDLKGARIPTKYTAQTTFRSSTLALLANAGLTLDDVKHHPVPNIVKGAQALARGAVDAAIGGPGAGFVSKAHVKLKSRGGLRFVSVDTSPAAVKAMRAKMKLDLIALKPAKHLPGIVEPTIQVGYFVTIVANKTVDDELVYRLVKTAHANKPYMVKSLRPLARFNPNRMAVESGLPYHPGAAKFFKEVNQWPPQKH